MAPQGLMDKAAVFEKDRLADARKDVLAKLHKTIDEFESDDSTMEFHRLTPVKSPTVVLTGLCDSCAGRNSINRYLQATGLSAMEAPRVTFVSVSPIEKQTLISHSLVRLPVKVPGQKMLSHVDIAVFDGPDDFSRNFPIKLNQSEFICGVDGISFGTGMLGSDSAVLFPSVNIPKCGCAFELFPFPTEQYDEDQTEVFAVAKRDLPGEPARCGTALPTQRALESALADGPVKVVFTKVSDGEERALYGTTREIYIPRGKRETSGGRIEIRPADSSDGEVGGRTRRRGQRKQCAAQVHMFDVELHEWRSCRYETIVEVRIKQSVYRIK